MRISRNGAGGGTAVAEPIRPGEPVTIKTDEEPGEPYALSLLGEEERTPSRIILPQSPKIVKATAASHADILLGMRDKAPAQIMEYLKELILIYGSWGNFLAHAESLAHTEGLTRIDPAENIWNKGEILDPFVVTEDDKEYLYYGFYRGAVTLKNGGSGAGKSFLVYNVVYHLAAGSTELWGVPMATRPGGERCYVIDPENRGGVRADRLKAIEQYTGIPYPGHNLTWHNAAELDLSSPTVMAHLADKLIAGGYTVVVLDPISFLFHIESENDNGAAQKQMRSISELVDKTGCCVLAIHHTGKGEDTGARGAQAREDLSYVVMDLRLAGDDEDKDDTYTPGVKQYREDIVRLRKRKDRMDGAKTSLYLRMDYPSFISVPRSEWVKAKSGAGSSMSAHDQATTLIRGIFDSAAHHDAAFTRQQVLDFVKQYGPKAPGKNKVDDALKALSEGEDALLRQYKMGRQVAYCRADVADEDLVPFGGDMEAAVDAALDPDYDGGLQGGGGDAGDSA